DAKISQTCPYLQGGHVGMHVRHEQVEPPVLVVVEGFYPHGAPRGLWKQGRSLVDEPFSALVFIVMIVPLHIQDVEIGKVVFVEIDDGSIAAPASIPKPQFPGN